MARDWRKVALAVLAAAALASVCALDTHAQATKQSAKAAKSPDKSAEQPPEPEEKDEAEEVVAKAPPKKKRQDPVEAQRAIEAAGKLLQTGKAEQAAQALTATLAGGNLPPAIMAKALYVRGMAYRQQSKPAQAISDLTSALWLKGGLAESERADALKQRAAAYSDAGLTENGEAIANAPAAKEKSPAPAKSWGAVTSAPDATASNNTTGGNWFSNWFNSAAPPAQANAPPQVTASIAKPDPPPPPAAQPPPAPRVSSAWSNKTEVHADVAPAAVAGRPPPTAKAEGKYRVQLATVRTQEEARALAAKAKRELGGALAAREPEIDQAVLGNMGAFYRVRVGPFATMQETQAVCAKVKGTGFDCMSVTQ